MLSCYRVLDLSDDKGFLCGKIMRQLGLFDEIDRLKELTELGDPLMILNDKLNWESFRKVLRTIRPADNPDNEKNAARKPFDEVMMFMMTIFNISERSA